MKCKAITVRGGSVYACCVEDGQPHEHRTLHGLTWQTPADLDGFYTVHDTLANRFDLSDVKPRWDLIPFDLLASVERVLTFGGVQPGRSDFGWKDRPRAEHYQAFLRHVIEYACGKRIDDDTKQPVLAHVIARSLFLMFHDGGK